MEFLGVGLPEILVILLVAILVVGPQRLPQTAAQIARFIRQARRYATEVTEQLQEELDKLEAEYQAMQAQLRRTQEELERARQEADRLVRAAAGLPEEGHPEEPALPVSEGPVLGPPHPDASGPAAPGEAPPQEEKTPGVPSALGEAGTGPGP